MQNGKERGGWQEVETGGRNREKPKQITAQASWQDRKEGSNAWRKRNKERKVREGGEVAEKRGRKDSRDTKRGRGK